MSVRLGRASLGLGRRRGRRRLLMGYRRRRRVGRWFALVLVASLAAGWYAGRLRAVPERPEVILPVYRHDLGVTVAMELEEYVKGVIAAEMPVEFHPEALKAQAVAARTLALYLLQRGERVPDHPEAVVSTDHQVHQAWLSQQALRERWGAIEYYWRWAKVSRAVAETRGLVMVYNGELIYPAYHASSGGRTEDSENYWSSAVPYLRSVEDPYVKGSRYEKTHSQFTVAEVSRRTGAALPASTDAPYVRVLSRFPSGRVEWVQVGDQRLTGRQLREMLGLRSNWFEVHEEGDRILFEVYGYGHGIGMSQYGADGMARAGRRFDQILTHYYTGVEIVAWYD